uniref:Uncharacterized protein n=1 Tax=Populus alba TaxID=43335 RepID=A0A4U5P409_POPAL|nr:hypothetical protein D5086_0000233250 [Populus alba]
MPTASSSPSHSSSAKIQLHSSPLVPPSISLHNVVLPVCSPSQSTMSTTATLDTLSSSSTLDPATQFSTPADPDFHQENLCVVLPLSPINLHPMTTRSKNDILTKGISSPLSRHHCSNLMLGSSMHTIAGECEDINQHDHDTCHKIIG